MTHVGEMSSNPLRQNTLTKVSIVMVRHGPTAWNAAKRLQGRHDEPLSPESQVRYGRYELSPVLLEDFKQPPIWVTSPLQRAAQTAMLLGGQATPEPRLIEMDWGQWEGRTVADLRAELGPAMKQNEARGLDFQPPEGESPRMVLARLSNWLEEVLATPSPRCPGQPIVAVTHKGVLRAMISLATGWPFIGKPPLRIDWHACHLFEIGHTTEGGLNVELVQANIPFAPSEGDFATTDGFLTRLSS